MLNGNYTPKQIKVLVVFLSLKAASRSISWPENSDSHEVPARLNGGLQFGLASVCPACPFTGRHRSGPMGLILLKVSPNVMNWPVLVYNFVPVNIKLTRS